MPPDSTPSSPNSAASSWWARRPKWPPAHTGADPARPTDATGRTVAVAVLSLAGHAVLWTLAAALADSRVLPGPGLVFEALAREAASGALFQHLGATLLRVVAAFVLAMAIGSAIGIALGLHRRADRLFDPWLTLFLNQPALVVIVLAYIWFGSTRSQPWARSRSTRFPTSR